MKLGSTDISNLMVGNQQVSKVMLGDQLVWPTKTSTIIEVTIGNYNNEYFGYLRKGSRAGIYSSSEVPSSDLGSVSVDSGIIPDGYGIAGIQWDLNMLVGQKGQYSNPDVIRIMFTDASYPYPGNDPYWGGVERAEVSWPRGDIKFSTNSSFTSNVRTIAASSIPLPTSVGGWAYNYGNSQLGWDIPASSGQVGFEAIRDYFFPDSLIHSGTFYVEIEE